MNTSAAAVVADSRSVDLQRMAHAIRFLSIDAIVRATEGHQGVPLGMAEIATALFTRHMKFNLPIRHGPTVIESCSPMATVRCCCFRCCT